MLDLVLVGFVVKELDLVDLLLLGVLEDRRLRDHGLALSQDFLDLREVVLLYTFENNVQLSSEVAHLLD